MKYRFNLVREIQQEQRDAERLRIRMSGFALLSFGLLGISFFFATLQTLAMQSNVRSERARLKKVVDEFQQYKSSVMFVNKSDVEMLDQLQNKRIFWTAKLVTLARYLPDNYWITRFGFTKNELSVGGYGYITPRQQQLITLDDYLARLRQDKMFNDVFKQVALTATSRNDDEQKRARVSFSYVARLTPEIPKP